VPVDLSRNDDALRYEARLDGQLVGFAEFQLTDDLIVFTHTHVEPVVEGQGVGSAIARFALDDVRRAGDREVLPRCPFFRKWIRNHPEYGDLVRRTTGLAAGDSPGGVA
jgi:predicted GNAT family acetyltransferase